MAKVFLWLLVRLVSCRDIEQILTVSEIIFNPIRYWPTRSPFSKLFRTFLWSPIPPHAKWSILAYMFSYYALSLSWLLSLINFVIIGSLSVQDTFYVTSWQVFFICLLLFQGLNNVAVCILRYRLKLEGAGRIALQQFKWIRESLYRLICDSE